MIGVAISCGCDEGFNKLCLRTTHNTDFNPPSSVRYIYWFHVSQSIRFQNFTRNKQEQDKKQKKTKTKINKHSAFVNLLLSQLEISSRYHNSLVVRSSSPLKLHQNIKTYFKSPFSCSATHPIKENHVWYVGKKIVSSQVKTAKRSRRVINFINMH